MPVRTLGPSLWSHTDSLKGVDTRQCANKDAGPFVVIPHRLEKGTSASKDAE